MIAFAKAAPTLIAAEASVVLVWSWFTQPATTWLAVTLSTALLAALGLVLEVIGRRLVTGHPVGGRRLMEFCLMWPICVGAFAGAGVLVLAIWLDPNKDASVEQKKVSAAIAGAVSTFVATLFLKGLDDLDGNYVGAHIKDAFEKAFANRWTGADADKAAPVFDWDWSGYSGWSRAARAARARQVESQLP